MAKYFNLVGPKANKQNIAAALNIIKENPLYVAIVISPCGDSCKCEPRCQSKDLIDFEQLFELLKANKLRWIRINNYHFKPYDLVCLARGAACTLRLEVLDLSTCHITDHSLVTLFHHGLAANRSIKKLGFGHTRVTECGADYLAQNIPAMKQLEKIDVHHTMVLDMSVPRARLKFFNMNPDIFITSMFEYMDIDLSAQYPAVPKPKKRKKLCC